MTILLFIAGATLLVAVIVLLFCVANAPDGHEDASGFHSKLGERRWDHAKLEDASREFPGIHR